MSNDIDPGVYTLSDPRDPRFVLPQPLDTIAFVTVRLHANGSISTQGTIVDKPMALHLLEQARDAIKRQVPDDKYKEIVVPNRDVDMAPMIPTRDLGSMLPGERGDS